MGKEVEKILVDAGRDMAERLIRSAVTCAESKDQMDNQVFVLKRAAINILAHDLYNLLRLTKSDEEVLRMVAYVSNSSIDDYLNQLMTDLTDELVLLTKSEDAELVKTRGQ